MKNNNLNLQTGDILLYHGSHFWFSLVVEYFTGSKFSHTAMVIKDPEFTSPPLKGLYILESGTESFPDAENHRKKFGVQLVSFEKAIKNYNGKVWVRRLKCRRDKQFFLNLAEAHSNIHNEPYDTDIYDMLKAIDHDYDSYNTQKQTTYWCSAMLAYVFTKLGFLPKNTPWTLIEPDQFSSTYKNKKYELKFKNCELDDDILIHDGIKKDDKQKSNKWFYFF